MTEILNYVDQSPYSLSAYIVLLTFSIFFVALRVFVKARIVRLWGYEDYATIFALVRSSASSMSTIFIDFSDLMEKGFQHHCHGPIYLW